MLVESFLTFMLTRRGIEADLDKCHTIIGMRSLAFIKEVHKIIGRIPTLTRFLSCSDDKFIHF